LDTVFGKKVRIETIDGSVRHGVVEFIETMTMYLGTMPVEYPRALMFDKATGDGVEIHIIKRIDLDEQK
jgi:hypothetical protein